MRTKPSHIGHLNAGMLRINANLSCVQSANLKESMPYTRTTLHDERPRSCGFKTRFVKNEAHLGPQGPNSRTVAIHSAIPHLENHFQDVVESTCFANIDLAHGYWQIAVVEESQEMMSIQTPLGIYSSCRLLEGHSDSGNNFQVVLSEKF